MSLYTARNLAVVDLQPWRHRYWFFLLLLAGMAGVFCSFQKQVLPDSIPDNPPRIKPEIMQRKPLTNRSYLKSIVGIILLCVHATVTHGWIGGFY